MSQRLQGTRCPEVALVRPASPHARLGPLALFIDAVAFIFEVMTSFAYLSVIHTLPTLTSSHLPSSSALGVIFNLFYSIPKLKIIIRIKFQQTFNGIQKSWQAFQCLMFKADVREIAHQHDAYEF